MAVAGLAVIVLVAWSVGKGDPETTILTHLVEAEAASGPVAAGVDPIAEAPGESAARSTIAPSASENSMPAAIRADQLRLLVVDELTTEPLPRYILRIWLETTSTDVTSDDTGMVVVDVPPGTRSVDVFCIDLPIFQDRKRKDTAPKQVRIDLPASEDPLVLRAPAGPTFRLQFEPDDVEAPSQINAALYVSHKQGDRTSSWGTEETPVRDGPPAWVRFAPRTATASYAEYLHVQSRDGLWSGRARVSATRGIVPDIVLVKLEPHSSIEITVVDASGAPVHGAEIGMRKRTDSGPWRFGQLTDKNGKGGFIKQDPGPMVVRAQHLRHEPNETEVELEPGKFAHAEVVLRRLDLAGSIQGAIVSDSGTYVLPVRVRLTPIAPSGLMLETRPEWTGEEHAKRATFRFDALPSGLYRLHFVKSDYFEWSADEMELRPPRNDVVIAVHDRPTVALGFRLRNARTGDIVTGARACVRLALKKEQSGSNFVTEGQPTIFNVPVGVPVDWLVEAPGFRPARGNIDSFTVEQQLGQVRGIVAEVSLQPGWGRRYRVMQERTEAPIAGVKFLVDGVHVTTSDASGFAEITLDKVPQRITVESEGWSKSLSADVRLAPNNGSSGLWTRIDLVPVAR
jgi:hypothetical protein